MAYLGTYGGIKLSIGSKLAIVFQCLDENEDAIDLDGYSAVLSIRKEGDTTNILDLDSDGNGIVIETATGKLNISVTSAQSAEFTEGTYQYDCYIIDDESERHDVARGDIIAVESIVPIEEEA